MNIFSYLHTLTIGDDHLYNHGRYERVIVLAGDKRTVRQPRQKRAIEKKSRIIEAGFKLFCEKGFHNTNTVEIAKAAGVSTGILYNYFVDKKDIFLAAIDSFGNRITLPAFQATESLKSTFSLPEIVRWLIDSFIKSHDQFKSAHEEIRAMALLDPEVASAFNRFDLQTVNDVVKMMQRFGLNPPHPYEKAHIAVSLVENLCHEILYSRHEDLDYDIMIDEVARVIVQMLSVNP
ncbi:MAG TPA: hypothetical protein DHD79_08730 [Firmicutes bacterium]|nr:hypothetical protein [Bacillota bacterium]HAW69694.1 hypothetical protein [Bacillota bacterium]HBG45279.1 hypothetical protein [Bacillota bacterium]HBL50103.1 hypothetical protein [Bacillota bacterium]HCF88442.1 hypothetical protein [Bacillota bacterium]